MKIFSIEPDWKLLPKRVAKARQPGTRDAGRPLRGSIPAGTEAPAEEIYWISAADPASVCGLGLPIDGLPPRLAANHLVYHGSRLVLVSKRRAAEVELRVPPEDSSLLEYLRVFSDLLGRDVAPRKAVRVQRINGVEARQSPYKGAFLRYGFVDEYRGLILRAGY